MDNVSRIVDDANLAVDVLYASKGFNPEETPRKDTPNGLAMRIAELVFLTEDSIFDRANTAAVLQHGIPAGMPAEGRPKIELGDLCEDCQKKIQED